MFLKGKITIITYFRTMLTATGIYKKYDHLEVLKGVDIHIGKGEIVSIVGSSGAGKSTLLHILGTLDQADKGRISLNGQQLEKLGGSRLSAFRNKHIGFIFQFHHLLPEFTALENVCIPGWIAGYKKREVVVKATELLKTLGLEDRLENKPQQLSGGEQQRVAVARALINNPAIVMADEPTGNLDPETSDEIMNLLFNICRDYGTAIIMATHDYMVINKFPARVVKTERGKVIDNATISSE